VIYENSYIACGQILHNYLSPRIEGRNVNSSANGKEVIPCPLLGKKRLFSCSQSSWGVDLVVVRPLWFVATVLGTAAFIVSLPFTIVGGNTGEAGQKLVVAPAKYTFTRPLGKGVY